MARTIYLNFGDLNEESQQEILDMAKEDIMDDDGEMETICEMYAGREEEIIRERAERKIHEYDYVFNI